MLNYEEIYSNKRINYEDYLCDKELERQEQLFKNGEQKLKDELSFFQIGHNNINKFAINYFKNTINIVYMKIVKILILILLSLIFFQKKIFLEKFLT